MKERSKVWVLGGTGMLGQALVAELAGRGERVAAFGRDELDLARSESCAAAFRTGVPRAVFNAAAYTDVAACERRDQREKVYRINRDAPAELAGLCAAAGVPLIHVSTDYVFDGRRREPYREQDPVAPLQVYGNSKLEGERAVAAAYPGALIVRVSTLFGPGRRARPHFVDAVLRRGRETGRVECVRPPVSSPTYAPDLARGLLALAGANATGLVHLVNRGECSRLELAREIFRRAGLADRVEVVEREAPADDLARPAYSVLDAARYTALTGQRMRDWRDALGDYLAGETA